MIYRVLYDGVDIHTNSVPDVLINPTVETEMNTAGSFTFTLPPDHFAWGDIYVFKGNVEVYENNDLIFFGRVANVDQNWNNERVVECEGALAFFNDSIQRPNSWTSNTLISQFLSDILDNHNAQVPDDRKIYLGNVTIDDMYVTRETNYEKTLDVLTRMCIDTNGGYFSLRKDENDGKIYLDWLKDLTDIAAQPVEFGLNLLDISRSLHAEDICTGVLARGGEVNNVKIDLHEVGEIDDPSIPVIHHTNQDPDILWHRDGLEGYGRVVQVKEFNDCTTVDGDNGLLAKATEWLIKQNTDIDTIEVDAAELGYFGESYPIFLLGQKVVVNSHPHHLENVELPMYKISMNLDSGTKRISIGTPPKRELTQISASNMGGGSGSGSSSGGGSGSGGVQDVRVNGTSVVQDGIARVSVPTDTVTESEMNTAISTAVSGKANQSDLESLATTVSGKANTSEVTAALALKADKTEIPEIEANPSDAATDTLNKIDIEGTVYQLAGGTQVEANPVEAATDDLETIKIGNTVYDIPGSGGGSTNYGKFKCDVLFNTPTTISEWANPIEICSEEKAKEYDMLHILSYTYTNEPMAETILVDDIGQSIDSFWIASPRTDIEVNGVQGFIFLAFTNSKLCFYTGTGNSVTLYKVYGLKFENKLINRSDIYSEEERMIGRWTDGKPLYQKTIKWDNPTLGRVENLPHGINNVDHIHILWWKAGSITGTDNTDSNYWADVWLCSDTGIYYRLGPSWGETIKPLIVTFQYTKTTDSADSGVIPEDPMIISDSMIYSEEEQVVGSWTDGKPLYQRTYRNIRVTNNADNVVDSNFGTDKNICTHDIEFRGISGNYRSDYNTSVEDTLYSNNNGQLVYYFYKSGSWSQLFDTVDVTIQYTKTTDSVLSGPKKGKIVQRSDIYSEEERMIGRWTDGKPLYQKTIVKDLTLSSSWQNYYDLTGIDLVNVEINKLMRDSEPIPLAFSNIGVGSWIKRDGYLKFCVQGSQASEGWVLKSATLKYTKATDLPFSKQLIEDPQFVMMSDIYSEDEQVVGRWTDGKPLYQKTVDVGTIIYDSSWHTVPHNIQNVDEIMVVNGYVESSGNTKYWFSAYRPGYSIGTVVGVSSQNVEYINNWLDTSENPKLVITVQYTKTTDIPGTGPTKGNLIYLPALYSEEEREVGVWTDGKPLYQKTVNFGTLPNNTTKTVSSGLTNVVMHNIFGVAKAPNGFTLTLPHREISGAGNVDIVYQADNYIRLWTDYDYSSYTSYITLQYTKTTDQPGSGTFLIDGTPSHNYSTSEKVVGTWIDGSTIYERTWDLGSDMTGSGNTWVDMRSYIPTIPNCNFILDAKSMTSDGVTFPLNGAYNAGYLELRHPAQNWSGRYIIIQYTKSS